MNEIWFCYTMLFILMCLFSASMSLSAYFVSHRSSYLGIMAFFIAYCLETSLIFLDEYSLIKPDTIAEIVTFPFLHPWFKLVISLALVVSVWWVVLEYLERRTWLRIAIPCGICALVQIAAILFAPDSRLSQWVFYETRIACIWAALLYGYAVYRRTDDDSLKRHLARLRKPFALLFALSVLVVAEDSLMMYVFAPQITDFSFNYHISERNLCENVVIITCAALAIRSAASTLALRFHEPPTTTNTKVEQRAHTQFARFADRHELTPRERDVLALLLEGKDNQNVASTLTLSLGTVKAHVHNIYRKANVSSRQQLLQSFWKED